MKIKFQLLLVICVFSLTRVLFTGEKKVSQKQIQDYKFSEQNRPNFGVKNPFKGFSVFNFFPTYPGSKEQSEKINALMKKELEKIGVVKKLDLEVKNKEGEEGIDLSPFDINSSLIYEIKNLVSLDGKDIGFVRASLNFESSASILKTKQECSVYLWSSNCFLKGSTSKDLESLVAQSLDYLMKDFSESFSSANDNKPIFQVVTP